MCLAIWDGTDNVNMIQIAQREKRFIIQMRAIASIECCSFHAGLLRKYGPRSEITGLMELKRHGWMMNAVHSGTGTIGG
jgi:hypothetical protein